jgi:hypothetical protein
MITLAYVSIVVTLRLPILRHASIPPEQQKHTMLLQTYILTWILLLLETIAIKQLGIGGFYFVTAWNVLVFLGCAVGCVEGMLGAEGTQDPMVGEPRRRYVRGVRYERGEGDESESREDVEVETEPTEITPLIQQQQQQRRRSSRSRSRSPTRGGTREKGGAIGWWILQFLIVVPFPVILLLHLGIILVASLSQTLADGSSAVIGESRNTLNAEVTGVPNKFFLYVPM